MAEPVDRVAVPGGPPRDRRTLGAVTVHRPDRSVHELPAVAGLLPQVDELLVVRNGPAGDLSCLERQPLVLLTCFDTNRGTAAAWNAALSTAIEREHRYLYLLDQDSVPGADAVMAAREQMDRDAAAVVVQPAARDRFRLDPFPWNTVASGSLYDVRALVDVGGFDERLFVDEVDHELLARLLRGGHRVTSLRAATIDHRAGSPQQIRVLGRRAWVAGYDVERRSMQGRSAGILARRYARSAPATAMRLLLRHGLTAAKDLVAGHRASAGALLSGVAAGLATSRPPQTAAERACPYCEGPLLGRFGAVPDWRFGTGPPADVYRCVRCGALAAGRRPGAAELSSWYSSYYTHSPEPAPASTRVWSRAWPTPARQRELESLRRYLAPPAMTGRFLEVGTGSGERLVELRDAGWDVAGQDPDPGAGQVARRHGIPVHRCPVAYLVGREEPFDLIGLNHVLEHAVEPAELLEACALLLAPGGRVCVVSPNAQALGRLLFGRWWFGLEQPRHLAIPTLSSLGQATSTLGLQVTHSGTVATNAAVLLGGSLSRWCRDRLPEGVLRRGAEVSMYLLGQALGRAALRVDQRLGEEVVWSGAAPAAARPPRSGSAL